MFFCRNVSVTGCADVTFSTRMCWRHLSKQDPSSNCFTQTELWLKTGPSTCPTTCSPTCSLPVPLPVLYLTSYLSPYLSLSPLPLLLSRFGPESCGSDVEQVMGSPCCRPLVSTRFIQGASDSWRWSHLNIWILPKSTSTSGWCSLTIDHQGAP